MSSKCLLVSLKCSVKCGTLAMQPSSRQKTQVPAERHFANSLTRKIELTDGRHHLELLRRVVVAVLFEQQGNHDRSVLFKMAAPGKFENQNRRFGILFIADTNAFIRKTGNNGHCYVLRLKFSFFSCLSGGSF